MIKVLQWFVQSTWFKKYSAVIGGIALGMWIEASYWRQIKGTLQAWGIERDEFLDGLLLLAGAAGIAGSIGLSLAKSALAKGKNKP